MSEDFNRIAPRYRLQEEFSPRDATEFLASHYLKIMTAASITLYIILPAFTGIELHICAREWY